MTIVDTALKVAARDNSSFKSSRHECTAEEAYDMDKAAKEWDRQHT